MAIEFIPSTSIALPNITVYELLQDGVLRGHRLTANEGYVIYDTSANEVEPKIDPETGDLVFDEHGNVIEIPVTYYFRQATIPVNVPVENWTWVAVPESDVPADHIFGGGNKPDHEIM